MQRLAAECTDLSSISELYQLTATLSKESTGVAFGVVAHEESGTVRELTTDPDGWTDTDDLLSPVSLPRIAASQGQSHIIDDKSNVRSTAQASPCPSDDAVE